MKYPNLKEENKLWKRGFKRVVCLDEAGRGPLAGPVVAAAVLTLNTKYKILNTEVRDSKKLSQKQRERIYRYIIKNPNMEWGIGKVSEKVIDKVNILEATKLAMKKAVKNLETKSKIDFLILDGKMELNLNIPQKSIVKADEKVFSCSAASILAKVTRDRIMEKLHNNYPQYGFKRHKGYPTRYHVKMLKKYGRCAIHRNSFHYGGSKTKTH